MASLHRFLFFFVYFWGFFLTVKDTLIDKTGFVFQMFSLVLNCICTQTTITQLGVFFPACACKNGTRARVSFLYVFVASSPWLVLCPPTQNRAILSPSIPEMKYKPLKCILIFPCRPCLKNTHTHTDTRTSSKETL